MDPKNLLTALQEADVKYQAAKTKASTLNYQLEQEIRRQAREQEAARLERLRLVREARDAGVAFEDIASALGISRQRAWVLYQNAIDQKESGQ